MARTAAFDEARGREVLVRFADVRVAAARFRFMVRSLR
jgi:hypothetical protein